VIAEFGGNALAPLPALPGTEIAAALERCVQDEKSRGQSSPSTERSALSRSLVRRSKTTRMNRRRVARGVSK